MWSLIFFNNHKKWKCVKVEAQENCNVSLQNKVDRQFYIILLRFCDLVECHTNNGISNMCKTRRQSTSYNFYTS